MPYRWRNSIHRLVRRLRSFDDPWAAEIDLMVTLASTWLLLALTMSAFAWLAGKRWVALSLPLAVALAALAIYVPLGMPIPHSPKPGKYTVLGAKIVPDVGIWVLLDDGVGEPRYYRLPYSNSQANELQGAQDAGQGQPGSVKMQ